ncbi:MAG: quinone oxidoreductase [Magnetospirillum sp.]
MVKAIIVTQPGGPEVLQLEDVPLPPPAAGEVQIEHAAIGVNFVDIYHRSGLYPLPQFPAIPGVEGAGTVVAVGADVHSLRVGDKVAYAGLPVGSYAQARNLPAHRAIALPHHVDVRQAAANMLRGITAHMLLHRVGHITQGQTVLIHAAAGGLGLILTQWAKRLGAVTIGTVGSPEKAELAHDHGLDHAILYKDQDFVAATRDLTDGQGVDAAFDGIGGETLPRTLDCVRPFGLVASIGQAGGPIAPMPLGEIGPRRSLTLSRPSVFAYAADPQSYTQAAQALFAVLADGLRLSLGAQYALADAARAHQDMQSGRTTASPLLVA